MNPLPPVVQVDDDENDVLLLRYAYRACGIPNPLFALRDGQDAIDYLSGVGEFGDRQRYPGPPLLLLLDLKMPRRSGMDVLRWIRQRPDWRLLTVVMLTASANQRDVDEAYAAGVNSFIIKPAGTDKLAELLRVMAAYWFTYHRFGTAVGDVVVA